MTVPFFSSLQMPIKKAIATSAGTGVIITIIGALSYLYFGLDEAFYNYSMGYIYLPAFGILAVTTAIAAPLGAHLAHHIHTEKLKRIFSVCLIVIGIAMMVR